MDKFLEKHNLPRLNQNKIEKYEKTTTNNLNWYCDLKNKNKTLQTTNV